MNLILISLLSFYASASSDLSIAEDGEYYNFIDVYEYDANRFRRSLAAADMITVKWNNTLQVESMNIGKSMIKYFGCHEPWDCTIKHCNGIIPMQLNRNEKLQHKVLHPYDTADHAMGRMFEFLGVTSPKECGIRYEIFNNKEKRCKNDAIKIYKTTQQVGCSLLKCQRKEQQNSKPMEYLHFVCLFDPLISSLPVDSSEKLQLYTPTKRSNDICSRCPPIFPACIDGLCTSASSLPTPNMNLQTPIFLLLVSTVIV